MARLEQQKVWDPLIRLWHWLLAATVITNWIFGEFMSFETVRWHFYLGYAVLGLLAFRLLWGFVGPDAVRWHHFFPTPRALWHYMRKLARREPSGLAGHNPLGALAALGLLLVLLGQAGTGLFIESDDFFESGPLVGYVSQAVINRLTWWHHFLSEVLLALVVLHLSAIGFYQIWKRENLVKPMITGWKWVKCRTPEDDE